MLSVEDQKGIEHNVHNNNIFIEAFDFLVKCIENRRAEEGSCELKSFFCLKCFLNM